MFLCCFPSVLANEFRTLQKKICEKVRCYNTTNKILKSSDEFHIFKCARINGNMGLLRENKLKREKGQGITKKNESLEFAALLLTCQG